MPIGIIAVLVVNSICAASATVVLKIGATGRTDLPSFINPSIIIGLACMALGPYFGYTACLGKA